MKRVFLTTVVAFALSWILAGWTEAMAQSKVPPGSKIFAWRVAWTASLQRRC